MAHQSKGNPAHPVPYAPAPEPKEEPKK